MQVVLLVGHDSHALKDDRQPAKPSRKIVAQAVHILFVDITIDSLRGDKVRVSDALSSMAWALAE